MSVKQKILWLVMLCALCAALVSGCSTSPPKPPKLPVQVKSVAPRVVLPPNLTTNTLTWNNLNTWPVIGGVEWRPDLTSPWTEIASQSNLTAFVDVRTNAHSYYRVEYRLT